ncbi:MAG: hypothetical protein HUK15_00755, partial [Bacteroidales bacterium]|nr:hypothetical protein [Bacteroidales bacterium]
MKRNYSESLIKVLSYANEEVQRLNNNPLSAEHLLLGILRSKDCTAYRKLLELNVNTESLKTAIDSKFMSRENKPYEQWIEGENEYLMPKIRLVMESEA